MSRRNIHPARRDYLSTVGLGVESVRNSGPRLQLVCLARMGQYRGLGVFFEVVS
jgi:hypothetical protein